MKATDFKGIIPPMMTAFTEDGEIYEILRQSGLYKLGKMIEKKDKKALAQYLRKFGKEEKRELKRFNKSSKRDWL